MKLHIQNRLADTSSFWSDSLHLGTVSFLQLQSESYIQTLPAQPEYLLMYLKEGNLYLVRNRVESMYGSGSVLLLPPDEEYHLHFDGKRQTTAYWLTFAGFSSAQLVADSGLTTQGCFQAPADSDLSVLFEGILRQSLPASADARRLSLNSLGLFMQLLAAVVPRAECQGDALEGGTKALAYAVHQIQSDLSMPLDVEDMAHSLQMSASHFIRSFKAQVGYSPLAYQTRLRIERAKDLLRGTSLRVSEIALQIGYQNPMYFSSTFKKHTGMTPLEYRDKSLAS